MTTTRRVVTVHAEADPRLQLALLDSIEAVLLERGAIRIWIDPETAPELVVLAEFEVG